MKQGRKEESGKEAMRKSLHPSSNTKWADYLFHVCYPSPCCVNRTITVELETSQQEKTCVQMDKSGVGEQLVRSLKATQEHHLSGKWWHAVCPLAISSAKAELISLAVWKGLCPQCAHLPPPRSKSVTSAAPIPVPLADITNQPTARPPPAWLSSCGSPAIDRK